MVSICVTVLVEFLCNTPYSFHFSLVDSCSQGTTCFSSANFSIGCSVIFILSHFSAIMQWK